MPSNAAAKPRGPKRGSASRSARVEQKLDNLVAALQSRQLLPATPATLNQENADNLPNVEFEVEDGPLSPSTSHVSTTSSTSEDYFEEPSPMEADECLSRFREEMIVSRFPSENFNVETPS